MASEHYVGSLIRRSELDAFVSRGPKVYPLEQPLALSQQHRRNGDVQLVNEARTQVLLDRIRPSTNAHVEPVGGAARLVERLVNAPRDEVESSSARHLNGRAGVMRQDKNGNVIGRVVTPPPLPVLVRPRTADGSEHVSSEDPGSNILKATGSEVIVNPGRSAVLAEQGPLKRACWE